MGYYTKYTLRVLHMRDTDSELPPDERKDFEDAIREATQYSCNLFDDKIK